MNQARCLARFVAGGSESTVGVELETGGQVNSLFFRSGDVQLQPHSELLVACLLLPAMRRGESLAINGSVDEPYRAHLDAVQGIYHQWDRTLTPVEIQSGVHSAVRPSGSRVGAFFSGGVDSFYTLLEHQDEITDLIFVHGFDIRLSDGKLARMAEESVRRVGAHFGKRVIKIETNIRPFFDGYGSWGVLTHGAALAAVGHALPREFRRVYIAASDSYPKLTPWGSHPHLDPLWSRSDLEFVHDGYAADRLDKIRRIATSEIALQNLRVCWKNWRGALNCGRCEKCLRTMVSLRIAGALERCPVFAKPLTLWPVLWSVIPHPGVATGQQINLAALRTMPENRGYYWALRFAFARSFLKGFCRRHLSFGRREA